VSTVLVTGATGLIGSNVCRLLLEAGDSARALVRRGSDYGPLAGIGVEPLEGDITDAASVLAAAKGCDAIINSAAVLGGSTQDLAQQRATNLDGARHVYDAGAAYGIRVVTLGTTTYFQHDTALTEASPVAPEPSDDPYTVTKAAAYAEAMRRVSAGADIVVVIPGGTFGPGLSAKRALGPTSYNRLIRAAISGRIADYVRYPVPWVFAEDVAVVSVAAVRLGETGHKYLAFGQEDAQSTAAFLNVACEAAGMDHRVADVLIEPDDADQVARYGPSLVALSQRAFPTPWFDNSHTRQHLGYSPRPLREAMDVTVDWLRREGQVK
jgi:dihydroflavonol-4-reductase